MMARTSYARFCAALLWIFLNVLSNYSCALLKTINAEGLLVRRQHDALLWEMHESGSGLGEFTSYGQLEVCGGSDLVRD